MLSIVVPLLNEEEVINETYKRLTEVMESGRVDYEIIMVNDGSHDETGGMAKEICLKDKRVRLITFSRNFGHQAAISAGLDKVSGQAVVVIDADLQDPPEVILEMLEKWREGCQVVYGVRKHRQGENPFKLVTASLFYRILRRLTSIDIPLDAGDFRLMDFRVVREFNRMRERNRFVRGMVSWVGFRQGQVDYVREKRYAGETKYPLKKMVEFAMDGILSFSQVPLKLSTMLGFLCSMFSFLLILYGLVIRLFYAAIVIPGWASIFVASLFLGGVQLICVGILGEYVGRIYEEIKQRPLYIISEEVNFEADSS